MIVGQLHIDRWNQWPELDAAQQREEPLSPDKYREAEQQQAIEKQQRSRALWHRHLGATHTTMTFGESASIRRVSSWPSPASPPSCN
jgi:hypothetical protein